MSLIASSAKARVSSALFNLEKAEINSKIIEVDLDTDASGFYDIYLVDKHAVLDFTRLYQMVDQLNADGLFCNKT